MNIILIGAGQLGSRYLQGIAKVDIPNIYIEVVDPYQPSLDIAKERYLEIAKGNQKISFFQSIDDTKISNYDIAIISTTSNVRATISKKLLSLKIIKNLILEKVLFQKKDEYYEIKKLIKEKKIKTWVNHTRRMFPFYIEIKKMLNDAQSIDFSVIGGGLSLACNGLHFLDLFEYLSGKEISNINFNNLSKEIIDSKRSGFKEIKGMINGQIANNDFLIADFKHNTFCSINIISDKYNILIDETNNHILIIENETHKIIRNETVQILKFQSEITKDLIEDIYLKNNCNLPIYDESMKLHLKFILPLQKFINKYSDKQYDFCPIT